MHSPDCPGPSPRDGLEMTDRRGFLSVAALTGLSVATGAWTTRSASAVDRSAALGAFDVPWRIEVARVEQTFGDGTIAPFLRFRAQGRTPKAGTLPLLTALAGTSRRMTVVNTLDRDIQPWVVGRSPGVVVPAGTTRDVWIRVPSAGTWLLTDALLGNAAGPAGLGAVLVVKGRRPVPKRHRADREYVLLYQDADDRWNAALDAGETPDTSTYESNLHTLNGLTFPDTLSDPATVIACKEGERVRLRLANLGLMRQAIHFHGYHVDILERDRVPETILGPKDTIPLPSYTTTDVMLHVNQPGAFPVHPHGLTAVTDNGLYPAGQITLIQAT